MGLHGLDRAVPPGAAKAKAMLDEIDGKWWNVYIGGPEATHTWTLEDVREYEQHGIDKFLLCYVGRQIEQLSRLTTRQGELDGEDACQLVKNFGMFAAGTPVCLDLELHTFEASPTGSLDYVGAWCQTVRSAGLRPGVYANPESLQALHERAAKPDWVWIASWVRTDANPDANPHDATGVPASHWGVHGQRAWQYAGALGDTPCEVGGIDVEIDVADAACLATKDGPVVVDGGHPHPPPPPPPPPPPGQTYTVQPGDHLASIARRFNVAGGWPTLYALNRAVIGPDPDVLRPGEVLRLP
jgi:Domain of unknown function (DUF1906)/LysM domain